jgi:hypothetical protein
MQRPLNREPRHVTDPEQINVMKYNLLMAWLYLPAEHQAELLPVLLQHTQAENHLLGASGEVPAIREELARLRGEEEFSEYIQD